MSIIAPWTNLEYAGKVNGIAQKIKRQADRGTWNGGSPTLYYTNCVWQSLEAGTTLILTRDVGYHSSGWWKNPDFERCFHLSISFFDPITHEPDRKNAWKTNLWIEAIFGGRRRWLWCEPPYSADGIERDVWHYRLFCDDRWNAIKPRGEVYSKELTEAGWLSFSDRQASIERQAKAVAEREGSLSR